MHSHRAAILAAQSVSEARGILENTVFSQFPTNPERMQSLNAPLSPVEHLLSALMHRVITREFCAQRDDALPAHIVFPAGFHGIITGEPLEEQISTKLQNWLTIDGEVVYASLRDPFSLFLLFETTQHFMRNVQPLLVLRAMSLYQRCLKRKSHTLYQISLQAIEDLNQRIESIPSNDESATASALLEIALTYEAYQDTPQSTACIQRAARLQQLSIEETALVGIRTKWQSFQTAQLVVNANSEIFDESFGKVGNNSENRENCANFELSQFSTSLPTEVDGEASGHDLYTRPRSQYDTTENLTALTPLQCSTLLAICGNIERTNPDHDMTRERIQAYVERVLANSSQSAVTLAMALLVRSRIETHRARVAQRSLLQIQQLLEDVTVEKTVAFSESFFHVAFPSIHALRAEAGERYMEQNLFKTALEYFQELHDWRNVIACASRLEQRQSVAGMARKLLEHDPENVQLLVALGMSSNDEDTLVRAWETSREGSAEAARALAEFYVKQDDYEGAMRFFDACVGLNPTFGADWFTLGYAAMRVGDWQRAAAAFTRVCQMDPESAMGWNNLAMCLIRSKQLRPALHALTQALKFDRQSWQMWQNQFALAVELRELNAALVALENVVRFGGRKVEHDRESLRGVVDEVVAHLEAHLAGKSKVGENDENCQSEKNCEENENDEEVELYYNEIRPKQATAAAPEARHSPEYVERHATRLETVLGTICANHPFNDAVFTIATHFAVKRRKFAEAEAFCLGEIRALKSGDVANDAQRQKRLVHAGCRLLFVHSKREDGAGKAGSVRETITNILEGTKEMIGETALWQALDEAWQSAREE